MILGPLNRNCECHSVSNLNYLFDDKSVVNISANMRDYGILVEFIVQL